MSESDYLSSENINLRSENIKLKRQLDELRENVLVDSMNDMKTNYLKLEKERDLLKKKLEELADHEKKLLELQYQKSAYESIVQTFLFRTKRLLVGYDLVTETLESFLDDEDDLSIPEATFRGIISVGHSAYQTLNCYVNHEYPTELDCLQGKCPNSCRRRWCVKRIPVQNASSDAPTNVGSVHGNHGSEESSYYSHVPDHDYDD